MGIRRRHLTWTTDRPDPARLRRDGWHVVAFARLHGTIARARATGTTRSSLANPAADILRTYARHPRVAVLDAPCATVEDLAEIQGYVVEPAFRRDCTLLVHGAARLDDLDPATLADPGWGHPWTLERLRHLVRLYAVPAERDVTRRRRRAPWASPAGARIGRLDAEQSAAVRAGDGVVQVIAPAGSGKTTVLVARVRELLARGTPARRILCTTFNRDAVVEMRARLAREDLEGVEVRSFHGLGRRILQQEHALRARLGGPTHAQWRWLARQAQAAEPDGVWFDPAAAQAVISDCKLARMVDPAAALAAAADPRERTAARLYDLHERLLARQDMLDFDDLIARSVGLLQRRADVRRRWQARFARVLVDEYQDIEPAQALLVGILAAPQDSLFCVGDEDQCIYAWRRATVRRVIELDQVYPGLERFPLVRNYRCGRAITAASRRLVSHNRQRFRKPLRAGAAQRGEIAAWALPDRPTAAALVAQWLQAAARGEAAVLARTTLLLREVALACATRGLPFAASAKLVTPGGARGALEAYLRLLADPRTARADDLERALRAPHRSLPPEAAPQVAARLRDGITFTQALAGVDGEPWRRERLAAAGALLDVLAAETDAERLIARLRGEGGLDAHFAVQERMSRTERTDVETLAAVQAAARGRTARALAGLLGAQTALLRAHRRDDAVELVTVHGAKGREWDHVILYGADEGQLPHAQSLGDGPGGLEDERRLAYVAFTRARHRLEVVFTAGRPSRFTHEAGLG